MKKLFDAVTARLREFAAQRDTLGLIVRSPAHESAYILKILQGEDETDTSNVYWSFAEDFAGSRPYADAIVAAYEAKLKGVQELQAKEGQEPWPGLPPEAADPKGAPAARIKALMIHSRGLLPKLDGHAVIWTFFPQKIDAPLEYALFFEALLKHEMPFPWCHHLRILVRDERTPALLAGLPAKVGRLQEYAPDLSQPAMEKAVEEEAADETAPLPQRLQNALILANLDFSHRRYAEALKKYDVLLKYYLATKNTTFAALTLNGMGEVYDRMEKPREAKAHFEAALLPAIEGDSKPILLNISLNLGNLMAKHKQWPEAESYYGSAATFAQALLIPQTRMQALDNQAQCLYRLGKPKEALEAWDGALTLAKGLDEKDFQKQMLQRKQALFRATGHTEHEKAVTKELEALA